MFPTNRTQRHGPDHIRWLLFAFLPVLGLAQWRLFDRLPHFRQSQHQTNHLPQQYM
jgi:hypothetical protein